MTVTLGAPRDLDLSAFRRVAWDGEGVAVAPAALDHVAERRRAFEAFVAAHEGERLYGITTAHHRGATRLLDPAARVAYARRIPPTPASFGERLPERVVRGIVVARLAGFLAGGAAVRPELARAVAEMLDGPMPPVPARGHGDSGEIIANRATFGHLELELELAAKEGMALVNGAPASAAVLADAALAGQERLALAEEVLALAYEAALAPLAHVDPALDEAWGDPHEGAALRRLRELLAGGHADRGVHQAAVAFRDAPRLLGWLRRAQAQAEACAAVSLAHPGDNPTFVPAGDGAPARILSNAGYHDPRAAPVLGALAAAWADLASLACVQAARLAEDPSGLSASESVPEVTLISMTALGWAEEARAAAGPALLSLGGSAPSDTSSPALPAWQRAQDAGRCLEAVLAVLAVLSAHTIAAADRRPPPALGALHGRILDAFPAGLHARDYGAALGAVALKLTAARTAPG